MALTLCDMPLEVLELILKDARLTVEDVENVANCCKQLNILRESNLIWKAKFLQRYPSIHIFNDISNWYQEVLYMKQIIESANAILEEMTSKNVGSLFMTDILYQPWLDLINERENISLEYVTTYLREQAHQPVDNIHSVSHVPLKTIGSRTMKYYSKKVLEYVRRSKLREQWNIQRKLPEKIVEIGAVFVSQWCQADKKIEFDNIATELDKISEQVKDYVRKTHPQHSLLKKKQQEFQFWKSNQIDKNQYNKKESRELWSCLKHVLVEECGFVGAKDELYYSFENSYIDHVLSKRSGIPITLCIIYEAVARRLGLKFFSHNNPGHYLLRFHEENIYESNHFVLIDAYNGGIETGGPMYLEPSPIYEEIMLRMCRNINNIIEKYNWPTNAEVLSIFELMNLINPRDHDTLIYLAGQYMISDMDTRIIEERIYKHIPLSQHVKDVLASMKASRETLLNKNMLFKNNIEPVKRTKDVKFAVGMVMKHLLYNYTCVITDWHTSCMESNYWKTRMGVANLKYADKQPFYSVIADDWSVRYVAQENLKVTVATKELLAVHEIGAHFSHYFRTHFVPNEQKAKKYPEDTAVRYFYYEQSLWDKNDTSE